MLAKAMRALNALMFRALDAAVIIGRDTEKPLLRYGGMTRNKIRFIPNWATWCPAFGSWPQTIRIAVRFCFVVGPSVYP